MENKENMMSFAVHVRRLMTEMVKRKEIDPQDRIHWNGY